MPRKIDEVHDGFEGVVDLVGDRRGKPADGGELFTLNERGFRLFQFDNFASFGDEKDYIAIRITDRSKRKVERDGFARWTNESDLLADELSCAACAMAWRAMSGAPGVFANQGESEKFMPITSSRVLPANSREARLQSMIVPLGVRRPMYSRLAL